MKKLLFIVSFVFVYSFSQVSAQVVIPDSLKNTKIETLINDIVKQKVDAITKVSPTPEKRPNQKVSPLKVRLDVNGNLSEGNVSRRLLSISGDFNFQKKSSPLEFYISPQYTYGTQNRVLREDEFITRAGFNINIIDSGRVYLLAFGARQISHLRRIKLRSEDGLGIGFRFFRKASNTKFSITSAFIYENTNFLDIENDDIETLSLSVRFKGGYKLLNERLNITHVFFVQPSLQRNYFRFIGNLRFAYKLNNRIDFNIIFRDTYESIVADDRVNNDFNMLIGLSFHPFRN